MARIFRIVLLLVIALALGALLYPILHPQTTVAPRPAVSPEASEVASATPGPTSAPSSPSPSPSAIPQVHSAMLPKLPSRHSGEARLAIIIDDCGQWPDTERAIIALPIPITLSVMPHVRYTKEISQEAASAGKGVMMHLPMEPLSGANPGTGKVTTAMSDEAIQAQVADDVAQVPLARGVNNHEGSKATGDPRVMRAVSAVLQKDGLFFVDSRTAPDSVAAQVTQDAGIPTASRDVFLDDKDDVVAIETQLREAATIAKETGQAIAIGHPRAATLAALQTMVPELQNDGVDFTLVQDLVKP